MSGPLLLKPFESVLTDDPLTILDNRLEVALANRGVAVRSEAGATIDVTLLDAWWVLARPEVRVTTFVRLRVSCLGGDAPLELVLATSDRDLDLIDSSPQRQVTSFEAAFTELAEKVALACAP